MIINALSMMVELRGVEPRSKQGNNTLSTCLSSPGFSCANKTEATNLRLILCYFMTAARQVVTISDLAAPSDLQPRSEGLGRMSRLST